MTDTARRFAIALTGVMLWTYPPAFRREVGSQVLADVRRRAAEHAGRGTPLRSIAWLGRLAVSLLANSMGAWAEWLTRSAVGRPAALRGFSALDFKLGLRMLARFPGLTFVAGSGIAVAIAICGGFFAFAYSHFYPTIPLPEGDRLVGLENWDLARNNEERRSIHDFDIWRDGLTTVEDLAAFRPVNHNLIGDDDSVELIEVAEITPSAFTLVRVPPFMGRRLVEADAEPEARAVIVVSFDAWRTRFGADPAILGRDVRLGATVHTVVGVMPDGFAFPVDHDFWAPLKARPTDYPMGEGPRIFISGRLAPDADLAAAQAELATLGARMAVEYPETHAQFRAQVMPYVYPLLDINQDGGRDFFWQFSLMNAVIGLVLIVVSINVAVLIYARAATRRGEIAVRTALGASRRRIIGQMFTEALVLAVGAAAVGLALARLGLVQAERLMATEVGTPFWWNQGLSGPAIVYVVALTVVTAAIVGIVPGLQATRRNVYANLNQFHGSNGPRLGRTWTALIVIQAAVTVVGLPIATATGWWEVREFTTAPTIAVDEFLGMAIADHSPELRAELSRQIDADPGIEAHAFMLGFPSGPAARVGFEDDVTPIAIGAGFQVRTSHVSPSFLELVEAQVIAGRRLRASDWDPEATEVAVVNRALVDRYVGEGDPVGRRFQYRDDDQDPRVDAAAPWIEIVGVVENLSRNRFDQSLIEPRVFRPLPRGAGPANLLVRTAGGNDEELGVRVRAIAARLDPTLRARVFPLELIYRQQRLAIGLVALVLSLLSLSVLLLSAAGIYALMSFAVSQRQREIGIRTALGAEPRRVLREVFQGALSQIAGGVAFGLATAVALDWMASGGLLHGQGVLLLSIMAIVMGIVGCVGALGPARRGLRIDPTQALKGE